MTKTEHRNFQINALYSFFSKKGYSSTVIQAFLGNEFCLGSNYISIIVSNYQQIEVPSYKECCLLYRIIFESNHIARELYSNIVTNDISKIEILAI